MYLRWDCSHPSISDPIQLPSLRASFHQPLHVVQNSPSVDRKTEFIFEGIWSLSSACNCQGSTWVPMAYTEENLHIISKRFTPRHDKCDSQSGDFLQQIREGGVLEWGCDSWQVKLFCFDVMQPMKQTERKTLVCAKSTFWLFGFLLNLAHFCPMWLVFHQLWNNYVCAICSTQRITQTAKYFWSKCSLFFVLPILLG